MNKTLSHRWVVAYESLKTKEKSRWVSHNGVSQRWSQLELVAYESGRKESFDCTLKKGVVAICWGKFRGLRFAGSLISLITADENLYGMKGTGLAVSLKTINIQLQRYNNQELIKTIVDQYSMGYKKILFLSFFTVHFAAGCQSKG